MGNKSKQLRDCPAAGRQITSRECGEGRHSTFQCPGDCQFNPLTAENYDAFSEIEGSVINKSVAYFCRENRNNPALLSAYERAVKNGEAEASPFCLWHFFWARDAAGLTMADRWAAKRYDGLSNDERAVFIRQSEVRPAILEFRNVVSDTMVEAVDLFSGERVRIVDRSLASQVGRFTTLFSWLVPAPHFFRSLGTGIPFPEAGELRPMVIFRAIARQLGAPEDADEERRWLAQNWVRFSRAIAECYEGLRAATFSSLDAVACDADYDLLISAKELQALLEQHPNIARERLDEEQAGKGFTHTYVHFEASSVDANAKQRVALGSIYMSEKLVTVHAVGREKFRELQASFEAIAGQSAAFRNLREQDLVAHLKGDDYDASMVPQILLDHAPKISMNTSRVDISDGDRTGALDDILKKHREDWLDQPIPALDGKTPREAASASPNLRERLIHLVKRATCADDKKSYSESVRATELIQKLGLHEIAEPTPPERPALYRKDNQRAAEREEMEEVDEPPLSVVPPHEVDERIASLSELVKSGTTSALDSIYRNAEDLLALCDEFLSDELTEREMDQLEIIVGIIYFLLNPSGKEWGTIDSDHFLDLLDYWEQRMTDIFKEGLSEKQLADAMADSRQPFIATHAVSKLYQIDQMNTPEQMFHMDAIPSMLGFVLASIDAVDWKLNE